MARVATDDKADSNKVREAQAYAPSWVDRFTARVARLPGPSWSYYLGLGVLVFLLQTAVLWVEGALPIDRVVHGVHGFLAVGTAFFLVLFHYLDARAGAALVALRPALRATEQEYDELHYQLTTLPGRSTLLASVVALACMALVETKTGHYHLDALNTFPVSGHLLRFFYWLLWWVWGAFIFHTFHQLRQINRLYTQHTHIDFFRKGPLYALSNLAALTAGSMAAIPYGFLLVNRGLVDVAGDPVVFSFYLAITSLAVVTFVWPQLGIHRLQVAEKERLLDEANQRFQAIVAELHQRIDSEQLDGIGELNVALASLEIERNAVNRISTWPWEPEVVRLLISALALPLGLWVIQYILQRLLSS